MARAHPSLYCHFSATRCPGLHLRSEYSTYKFLEKIAVPAPRVFDMAVEGANNPVGVGYILTEKLPGTSLRWPLRVPRPEQRTALVEQLARSVLNPKRSQLVMPMCSHGLCRCRASHPVHSTGQGLAHRLAQDDTGSAID